MCRFLCEQTFSTLLSKSQGDLIVESYMSVFNFGRNHQTHFHTAGTRSGAAGTEMVHVFMAAHASGLSGAAFLVSALLLGAEQCVFVV